MAEPAGQITQSVKRLPPWVWVAIIGGGLIIGLIVRSRNAQQTGMAATGSQPPDSAVSGDGTVNPGTDPYALNQPNEDGQVYTVDPSTGMYTNAGQSGTGATVFVPPFTGGGPPNGSTYSHGQIRRLRHLLQTSLMREDRELRKLEKQLARYRHDQKHHHHHTKSKADKHGASVTT